MKKYSRLLQQEADKDRKIFWDISTIKKLSDPAIVERILNYGDISQFKNIIKDRDSFVNVYRKIKEKRRNNLSPLVINYVDLYLKNNA